MDEMSGEIKRSVIGQQEDDGKSIFSLGFGRQDPISLLLGQGARRPLVGGLISGSHRRDIFRVGSRAMHNGILGNGLGNRIAWWGINGVGVGRRSRGSRIVGGRSVKNTTTRLEAQFAEFDRRCLALPKRDWCELIIARMVINSLV